MENTMETIFVILLSIFSILISLGLIGMLIIALKLIWLTFIDTWNDIQ